MPRPRPRLGRRGRRSRRWGCFVLLLQQTARKPLGRGSYLIRMGRATSCLIGEGGNEQEETASFSRASVDPRRVFHMLRGNAKGARSPSPALYPSLPPELHPTLAGAAADLPQLPQGVLNSCNTAERSIHNGQGPWLLCRMIGKSLKITLLLLKYVS